MNLDGLVVNRYSKMCFPIGVGMKESTTNDYKVPKESKESKNFNPQAENYMINEEIFNPIEKKKKVQHYTCTDIISDINPDALFADGFDAAIIGYDANCTVVYDYDKCMEILMERDSMTEHEAHEYMEFNVVSAHVGDFTPIFIHRLD